MLRAELYQGYEEARFELIPTTSKAKFVVPTFPKEDNPSLPVYKISHAGAIVALQIVEREVVLEDPHREGPIHWRSGSVKHEVPISEVPRKLRKQSCNYFEGVKFVKRISQVLEFEVL